MGVSRCGNYREERQTRRGRERVGATERKNTKRVVSQAVGAGTDSVAAVESVQDQPPPHFLCSATQARGRALLPVRPELKVPTEASPGDGATAPPADTLGVVWPPTPVQRKLEM